MMPLITEDVPYEIDMATMASEYLESLYRGEARTPEMGLMCAILERGIQDACGYIEAQCSCDRTNALRIVQVRDEARAWVMEDLVTPSADCCGYGFAQCCEALGLSAWKIRREVLSGRARSRMHLAKRRYATPRNW